MAFLAELLLQFIFEVVVQIFVEIGVNAVGSVVRGVMGRENHHPAVAALGYLLLGACVGAVSVWAWPQRVVAVVHLPGISLILAPLVAGAAMHLWGTVLRRRGETPTNMATFLGGAAFALGVALVRFLGAH